MFESKFCTTSIVHLHYRKPVNKKIAFFRATSTNGWTMLTLTSIVVVFTCLAIGLEASGSEEQLPNSRPLGVTDSINSFKDYSGLLSLHDNHHDHDHGPEKTYLGESQLEEFTTSPKIWTSDSKCKTVKGNKFCIYANSSYAGGRGISSVILCHQIWVSEKFLHVF